MNDVVEEGVIPSIRGASNIKELGFAIVTNYK